MEKRRARVKGRLLIQRNLRVVCIWEDEWLIAPWQEWLYCAIACIAHYFDYTKKINTKTKKNKNETKKKIRINHAQVTQLFDYGLTITFVCPKSRTRIFFCFFYGIYFCRLFFLLNFKQSSVLS